MLPAPLAPLAAWPQFVAWKLEWVPDRAAWAKVPYSPRHGRRASSTNPADWGSYHQAKDHATEIGAQGVGFVLTAADPFFFIDVDKAHNGTEWSQLAQELCATFHGAAVEVSQSGTGLHLIGRGKPPVDHRNKNIRLGLELYTQERFIALTGTNATGNADIDHTEALGPVAARYFPPNEHRRADTWTTEPRAEWSGPDDDGALLEIALRSQSAPSAAGAFGGGETRVGFAALWSADHDALAARWPGASGQPYDASSADQALANQLAFWTGSNCERMERLMRQSSLARQKWDDRPDYLETTILKAAGTVSGCYKAPASRAADDTPPPPADPTLAEQSGFGLPEGHSTLFSDGQMKHFAGCVYVSGPHKILTPRGERLDQGRFNAVFGGKEFVLGADGKKVTTSAWDAFTLAQSFVPARADKLCFRPELGVGGVFEVAGVRMANTYRPITTAATEGDPGPYLDLIARQLPDKRDQAILLNYMASVVRNPGLKAQWWPVLQGVKGNGKTLHITAMVHAIGLQYCHLPNADKMIRAGMNFNGWVEGKLFIGLEEVHGTDRRAFFDSFKTTITNRLIPIEAKGVEETTGDNRANGLITCNPKDGVPVEDDERRYAPLFTAQQQKSDLLRDGMGPEYFTDLYDWLFGRNRYARKGADYGLRVINHHLRTMPLVAELDPAQLATRAPVTTSMLEAVYASRGRVEQEVLEAIDEGRPGFAGGWISSIKLDELLDRRKMGVPRNKRRDMLKSLGYDWHPALVDNNGRTQNRVMPDDSKPRLFCKIGSIPYNSWSGDPSGAARAYTRAQADALTEAVAGAFNNG